MKISVIIPVYNAEKYLQRCLDSILPQRSIVDFEVILVDDGSTDGSLSICRKNQSENGCIKALSQANAGAAAARATGFAASTGEWIAFVDADDTITPNALPMMLRAAESSDSVDIVVGQWAYEDLNGKRRPLPIYVKGKVSSSRFIRALLNIECDVGPVGKLFRRDLFTPDSFIVDPAIVRNEDLIMNVRVALKARNVLVCPGMMVYNYLANSASATSKPNSIKMWDMVLCELRKLLGEAWESQILNYFAIIFYGLHRNSLLILEPPAELYSMMLEYSKLNKKWSRFHFVSKYITQGGLFNKFGVQAYRISRRIRLTFERIRIYGLF